MQRFLSPSFHVANEYSGGNPIPRRDLRNMENSHSEAAYPGRIHEMDMIKVA